jgi:glycosyltransferase involved in cell wall biosynthesis
METMLARRPGALLEIVGDGPRRAELEQLAERTGIAGSVRFLGLRSRHEIAELMRQVDVFALPSLWENAPHVVIEALASGLPVVATDVGGVSELVEGFDAELVPPAAPDALADAIVATSERRDAHDPSATAARARERFGQEAVGRLWTQLYEEVVRERSRLDSRDTTSR